MLAAANTLAADSYGLTALHRCTTPEDVEALVALGLNVNAKTSSGRTPLHSACNNGHLKVAEALIAAGADVNAKTDTDWTPLHSACNNGHLEVAEALIAAGAEVNVKTNAGRTPLHWVCNSGHPKLAQALIAAGADVHAKDNAGATPLSFCETDEMRALLFARKVERTPKDLLTALKELIAQYE